VPDADALAGPDTSDLRFLEVGDDPDIVDGYEIEQRGARRDKPADADLPVSDDAVDRSADHSIVEVDPSQFAGRPRLVDGSHGGFALGGKNGDTLLLGLGRRLGSGHGGFGPGPRGVAFIDRGLADRMAADKLATPVGCLRRQRQFGLGRQFLRLHLSHQRMLKLDLGIDIGQPGQRSLDGGTRLREPGAIIPFVDPEQDVACLHDLIVPDRHGSNVRQPTLDGISQIAAYLPNIYVWDPFPILCPDDQCSAFLGAKPLFFDGDHVSGFANVLLTSHFVEEIQRHLQALSPDR